jgi:diacylglycerol kinase (ATP)
MRAAAILGQGCSEKAFQPFATDRSVSWQIGLPNNSGEADAILLFGGDGTIHRHLDQLVRLQLPLLVVPSGSGNDFAHALGLRSQRHARATWRSFLKHRKSVRTIDLGVITPLSRERSREESREESETQTREPSTYFCSIAGVGLQAEVTRRANRLPRWLRGNGGYALALPPAMRHFAPQRMKILISNEAGHWTTFNDQPAMLAAFANTRTFGDGMRIAPKANPEDGKLDICVIEAIDPFKLFCLFPTVYFGRHLHVKEVQYTQAVRIHLQTESPLDLYADGEYICKTPAELSVKKAALQVIIPNNKV